MSSFPAIQSPLLFVLPIDMLLIRWFFEMNPGYFVCLLDIPVIIKLEIPLLTSFISMDLEEHIMVLVSIHMSLGRLFGMRKTG